MKKLIFTAILFLSLFVNIYSLGTNYIFPGASKDSIKFYLETLRASLYETQDNRYISQMLFKGVYIVNLEISSIIVDFDKNNNATRVNYQLTSYENHYYLDFYEVVIETVKKEKLTLRTEIVNNVVNYIGENDKYRFTFKESVENYKEYTESYFYYVEIVYK